MTKSDSPWTDRREAHLKKRWAEGIQLKIIAEELNAMAPPAKLTRRAVQKRVRVLGLPVRAKRLFVTKWNDEMFATLDRMAGEGYGGQQIANALGVVRSTVCGHAKRRGLSLGGGRKKREPGEEPKKKPIGRLLAGTVPKAANIALVEASMRAETGLPPTEDLTSPKGCRWPVGDPANIAEGGFRYCQRERARRTDGTQSSYCQEHRARASGGIPSRKPMDETRAHRRGFKRAAYSETWT